MDLPDMQHLFLGLLTGEVSLRQFSDAGMAGLGFGLPAELRYPVCPEHVIRMIDSYYASVMPERALLNWAITVMSYNDVYGPNGSSRTAAAWAAIERLAAKYDPMTVDGAVTKAELQELRQRLRASQQQLQ